MTIKPVVAVLSLALAGFAAPLAAGGIDIRIGTGYPLVEHYRDYYSSSQYYYPPAQYYYRERRPAYRYNEYHNYFYGGNWRPAYHHDNRHRHDRHCRHDDDRNHHGRHNGGSDWREGHSWRQGHYDRWRGRDDD